MATQSKKSDKASGGKTASIQKMFNIQKTNKMKKFNLKKTVTLAAIATAGLGYGQLPFNPAPFNTQAPNSNIWRTTGRTGFGLAAAPTTNVVEVNPLTATDGVNIFSTSSAQTPALFLDHQAGGSKWTFQSTNNQKLEIFDNANKSYFTLSVANNGNCGIGSTPFNPQHRVHVMANNSNPDGVYIQNGSAEAAVFLESAGGAGTEWSVNNDPSGNFEIKDASSNAHFHIDGSGGTLGNVGIGTTSPNAKLYVFENTNTSAGAFFVSAGNSSVSHFAVNGVAYVTGGTNNNAVGAFAVAKGATNNNYGVLCEYASPLASFNAAVAAVAPGTGASEWAGHFTGNVHITNVLTIASDRKLKNNIKPMQSALSKLMLLKPSTYDFKTDIKGLNLPQGNQMGLIAQDLETVFPNLVQDVAEHTLPEREGHEAIAIPAYKSVNYLGLVPVLIAAVQEQQKQIEAQQLQIQAQQETISSLQQKQTAPTGIEELNPANGFYMENIPNPYSAETTIKYSLPQNVNSAYLVVYDLSGKQLASYPVNKAETSLVISAKDLSAGMYLYSIIADGKVLGTKRMVVSGK